MLVRVLAHRIQSYLRRQIESGVDAVMPNCCVFCGCYAALNRPPICTACYRDLPWIRVACPYCAMPLPHAAEPGVGCAACQHRQPPFASVIAPLEYRFPIDAAIKTCKFRRKLFYAPALFALLEEAVSRLADDIDAVVPVPLHRYRQAVRGFNQAAEIGRPVSRLLDVPLLAGVRRMRATPTQTGLTAQQRGVNLYGAFAIRGSLGCHHPLIVDDVVTTMATCTHLASALLEAGADKVSVLAVARATVGAARGREMKQS